MKAKKFGKTRNNTAQLRLQQKYLLMRIPKIHKRMEVILKVKCLI